MSKMLSRLTKSFAVIFLTICVISICGCNAGGATRNETMDVHDYAMNLLKDCDVEITNPESQHPTFRVKYNDKQVVNHHLNIPYDDWVEEGMPESGVDYSVYFIYDPTGEDHVLLYDDGKQQIMEFSIRKSNGDLVADMWMNIDGQFLTKNPINGDARSPKQQDALDRLWEDPVDYASALYYMLDYDYLAKIDPSKAVLSEAPIAEGYFGASTGSHTSSSASSNIPSGAISWKDVSSHIGEKVSVYGPVVDSYFASSSNGQPTFLDIGTDYTDAGDFAAVIWREDSYSFPSNYQTYYKGKNVVVTGEPYIYDGDVYIKLGSSSQIEIID